MTDYLESLVGQYRKKGILLDTNILLLFFIGLFDKQRIPNFKRTKTFAIEDYDTLTNFLNNFEKIWTTPNILTEVSNLSGELTDNLKLKYFQNFAKGINLMHEQYVPSPDIASTSEFIEFGLTDAGIAILGKQKVLVLTDDFRLSQYLQGNSVDVINFNHIRPVNWK